MDEEKLKESFVAFLFLIWRSLGLPDPTPVQIDIAKYLQHGGRRIVVEAFRGVGKSWITSAYVCWLLYCRPWVKILVVSASKERSDAFSTFTKRLIWEIPQLVHLKPSRALGDRVSNVAFDVRGAIGHAPSVKSVGITGQMTGSRADHIVVDDAEVVNNSETASQREKLLNLISEMGGAILTPSAQAGSSGGVVFLGTPQVEDSMYGKLPDRGYSMQIWPAEVPVLTDAYEGKLAPCIQKMIQEGQKPGTPTEPTRFGTAELEERRLEYGTAGFSLQFQLDTTLSDADRNPLKLADFIVAKTDVDICPDKLVWGRGADQEMGHLPLVGLPGDRLYRDVPIEPKSQWSPYEGSIMYIDPSGRGKDLTAFSVVKQLHGMLIIRRWGAFTGGYAEPTLVKLATIARDEKVNTVVIESNFGDGMYSELFKPILWRIYTDGCGVEDDHVSAQKEMRICDNLEPALAMHRLVIDEEVVNSFVEDRSKSRDADAVLKTAFFQLTRITRDRGCLKYDDLIDCLAGAVRWWTSRMARDVDTSVKVRDLERLDEMLDDFVNGVSVWKKDERNLNKKNQGKDWAQVLHP